MKINTLKHSCCICPNSLEQFVGQGIDFEYDSCSNNFSFYRCLSCGHVYIQPLPHENELSTIYPENYGNYSNSLKPNLAFKIKAKLESVAFKKIIQRLPESSSVLDVGCGDGRLLEIFSHIRKIGIEFHGIEISDDAANIARKKGFNIYSDNFESIDLANNRYSLITLIQVLEHFHNPNLAMKKLNKHLANDGILIIETPSTDCWDYFLFKKRYWGGFHIPRHFNLFNPKNIELLAKNNGLTIVSIKQKLQPVHWIWSFHHFFMEKKLPKLFYQSFNIKNVFWLLIFTLIEIIQVLFFKKSSNMQVILKKTN